MKYLVFIAFLFIQSGGSITYVTLKDSVNIQQMEIVQNDLDSIKIQMNEMIKQLNDTTNDTSI